MHKLLKYCLCFLFSFITIFISSIEAKNQIHFEYISDTYYTVRVGDYYYSYQEPFIYVDDALVYCLEPEKIVLESLEYTLSNNLNIGLTAEQLKQIELIGYYGYGYQNNNTYKYYLAAQELIWRIVRPNIIMSWATTEYGNTKISVEKEKEEIMFLVENHDVLPEINDLFLTLTLDQEITLYGGDILKTFEVKNTLPHTAVIVDENLVVKTSDTYIGKSLIELEKIKTLDDEKTKIYVLDGYQSLIYPTNHDEIKILLQIETKAGDITINKIDSETKTSVGQGGASLKGTTFEIYDKDFNLVDTLVIDKTGTAKTKTLKFGEYFISEIKSGEGYRPNYDMSSLTIGAHNLHPTITFENSVIKNEIQIIKTYGDDYLFESNAEFSIIDERGNYLIVTTDSDGIAYVNLPYGKYKVKQIKGMKNHYFVEDFEILVTDSTPKLQTYYLHNHLIRTNLTIHKLDKITGEKINSTAQFRIYDIDNEVYLSQNENDIFTTLNGKIEVNDICLGNYRIEEVNPPYGYKKDDNLEITLEKKDIVNNNIDIYFYNEFIINKVEIEKNGIDITGEIHSLDGVVFGIYALEDIVISDILYYEKDELIEELVTSNGISSSKNLPVGKYYIKELETVSGYQKNESIFEFTISNQEPIYITFTNQMIGSKINIIKKGINENGVNTNLNNVVFGIYANDNITIGKETYYQKDELIETLTTSDGLATSKNLPLGKYYVKELKPVSGYHLGKEKYEFEIKDEKDNNIFIYNQMILGKIEILKIGVDKNKEERLSGVRFGIYALNDIIIDNNLYYVQDQLVEELITNEGSVISKYLPFGEYYLKELETLDNYELDSNIYKIDIDDTTIYKYKIFNNVKAEEVNEYEIPDTEIKPKKINKMFVFIIIYFGYIIIKYAKK